MKPVRFVEEFSPGARRILKLCQWYVDLSGPEGCRPSVGYLARKYQVSRRTIKRWTAELESGGAIGKRRRGPHPNIYTLRSNIRCAQIPLPLSDEPEPVSVANVPSFGPSLPLLSINEVSEVKIENQAQKPEPESIPKTTTASPSETSEAVAVVAALAEFQYADGSRPDSDRLAPRLLKIGQFYGVSGYILGEKLNQVKTQVDRSPSTAPRGPAWFTAVVKAHCKREKSKSNWPKPCTPRPPDKPPEYPREDYCPEFTENLRQMLIGSNLLSSKRDRAKGATA